MIEIYFAISKNIIFDDLKQKVIRLSYEQKNISSETTKKVFKFLDTIQKYYKDYCGINEEDDGGITISLYTDHDYIMDIYVHEKRNIIWIEDKGNEILYEEDISDYRVHQQIKDFSKDIK